MRVFLNLLLFSILLLFGACETPNQRAISNIKTALKSKKYAEALRMVENARKDSLLASKPKLYYLGLESSKKMYAQENEKLYLRRGADTVALFRTLYNIYDYALLIDKVEQAQTGATPTASYRKVLSETLNASVSNLNAASLYFLRKQNWKEATRYATMALEAGNAPLFAVQKSNLSDSLLTQMAWRHLYSSYQAKQYKETLRYASKALTDTARRATTLEMIVNAQLQLQDKKAALLTLKRGVEEYPRHPFFYMTLAEYYFQQHQPDSVLVLTDRLLLADSTSLSVHEERARAYYQLQDYPACARAAEAMLRSNASHAQGYYYLGYSALQMAQAVEIPLSIHSPGYRSAFQKQRSYYKQAQKNLETYRRMAPQNNNVWAPLLYDIYLKLNLGKEFEEISSHLPS